jgi:hypothetical protein
MEKSAANTSSLQQEVSRWTQLRCRRLCHLANTNLPWRRRSRIDFLPSLYSITLDTTTLILLLPHLTIRVHSIQIHKRAVARRPTAAECSSVAAQNDPQVSTSAAELQPKHQLRSMQHVALGKRTRDKDTQMTREEGRLKQRDQARPSGESSNLRRKATTSSALCGIGKILKSNELPVKRAKTND